jgi:hypothetical protein
MLHVKGLSYSKSADSTSDQISTTGSAMPYWTPQPPWIFDKPRPLAGFVLTHPANYPKKLTCPVTLWLGAPGAGSCGYTAFSPPSP